MLADRLKGRVDLMANMMRPDGRPIFHERLSTEKAMQFWQAHRYDEMGQAVMSTWKPDQILQLDLKLAQRMEPGDAQDVPPA
jgi:hypothetical protein